MVPTYFGTKMTRVRGTAPRLPYCLYDGPRPMARRPCTSACRPKPEAPRSTNPSQFTGGRAPSPGHRGWRGRQASAPALAPGPQARTLHGLREQRTAFQGPGLRVCGQARGRSAGERSPFGLAARGARRCVPLGTGRGRHTAGRGRAPGEPTRSCRPVCWEASPSLALIREGDAQHAHRSRKLPVNSAFIRQHKSQEHSCRVHIT